MFASENKTLRRDVYGRAEKIESMQKMQRFRRGGTERQDQGQGLFHRLHRPVQEARGQGFRVHQRRAGDLRHKGRVFREDRGDRVKAIRLGQILTIIKMLNQNALFQLHPQASYTDTSYFLSPFNNCFTFSKSKPLFTSPNFGSVNASSL